MVGSSSGWERRTETATRGRKPKGVLGKEETKLPSRDLKKKFVPVPVACLGTRSDLPADGDVVPEQ
jgi:hypothetical protein